MKFKFNNIDKSWGPFLVDKKTSAKLKRIERQLKGVTFYPSNNNVFRFMKNDLNNVKYVVIGMDPYPQSYERLDVNGNMKEYPVATGRCFEPANYYSWTETTKNKSITNILKAIYKHETGNNKSIKEIRIEIEEDKFNILPPREFFDNLEQQGVLLLNFALTVSPNKPGSHIKLWEDFTGYLIKYINNNYKVTWILLGEDAKRLEKYITNNNSNNKKNIIMDVHPTKSDFYNNNKVLSKVKIDYTGYKKGQ